MNEEKFQSGEQERDLLDGGFAVVDREKIIEEETREITPWYMHFVNIFSSPKKMMEENFYHEPPQGMAIGIIGSILFTVIATLLTFINPVMKQTLYDQFRMSGISEEMIGQRYAMTQISGIIAAVVMIFVSAFLTALLIQIVKAIVKDKGKFGSLFVVALFSQMVGSAVMCVDKLIAFFIPTAHTVLGLPILLDEDMLAGNIALNVIAQLLSLPAIWALVILVIGYSVVTRTSIKKGIGVVVCVQTFFTLVGIGLAYVGQMMMQNSFNGM
ncbi:YIP1 family protein [Cellulosilyticum sp. I15G10I2]|uniref:YIP1 family protein n=1 Tax=Cellulosilyticum sp. I15G10I2 TaxID=1892843 RepID=UPI00085CCAA2|nr:YIP1 family protein [Cellulosilyticum sp. I15G10I2]